MRHISLTIECTSKYRERGARVARKQILVVEDDPNIAELLLYNLEKNGYGVVVADDGEKGLALARKARPDFVILDLMLPGIDGIEVCQSMRRDPDLADVPIIMLTARTGETDVVVGLTVGADDYIPKPFSPSVLMARIKAVARRVKSRTDKRPVITHGSLAIDKAAHKVFVDGEDVYLTHTEFRLLLALAERPGRALTRSNLLDLAIGEDAFVVDRTIDVHVASLRKKLGDCGGMIETVRGVGYRFKEAEE